MAHRKRILILCTLVAAGAALLALQPRGPRLEWYTSPPFSNAGQTFRMRLLVPEGWRASLVSPQDAYAFGDGNIDIPSCVSVHPVPDMRMPWAPRWLRRVLLGQRHLDADIFLYPSRPPRIRQLRGTDRADGVVRVFELAGVRLPAKCAVRGLPDAPAGVLYRSGNRAAFDATYRPICESFRVVR